MDTCPRRPVNKQISYDLNLQVSSLIGPDGKWREDLLNELFPPNEVNRILQMNICYVADR